MTGRSPQELVLHWNKLKSERSQFERTWQEIADYVRPLRSEFTALRTPGDKRHSRIFDSTPLMAAERARRTRETQRMSDCCLDEIVEAEIAHTVVRLVGQDA